MGIHPLEPARPFDAAACDAMGVAFDSAWQELLMSRSRLASSAYADATREALAMRIIDLANQGERDVTRLRDQAVASVSSTGAVANDIGSRGAR
jgi:hypothetical protein